MLKRINWRVIFKSFAWLACLAGVGVLMSFINKKKQEVKCIKVEILIPGADNFIEREEIDAILEGDYGQLVGRNLQGINIHKIEGSLKANPYIAFAKVYADMDGLMHIEIKQRQPVLRILNAGGQDFYIDSDGLKMPMSPNFTANVLVATGNILEGFGGRIDTLMTPLATDLYRTALYFKKDTLWDAQIEQLFVNDKDEIELIPRVGNQRIILGDANVLETKMTNLLAFYKQAMPLVGWNAYKTINLKYINQIVCVKNDSLAMRKAAALPVVRLDSNPVTQNEIDSTVKNAIKDEIKRTSAEEVKKQTVKETKSVVKDKTAEKKIKPVIKASTKLDNSITNKDKTATSKDKTKPATVKDKTDTKKPR